MSGSYLIIGYILFVILFGIIKKVNAYEVFIEGVVEGSRTVVNMFSVMLTFMLAVKLMESSGLIMWIGEWIHISTIHPKIFIQVITKPMSSSSSMVLLMNIYYETGVNSFSSMLSTLIHVTTDTTLYIVSLYYGHIGIKKIRYTLWIGLLVNLLGFLLSFFFLKILFKF